MVRKGWLVAGASVLVLAVGAVAVSFAASGPHRHDSPRAAAPSPVASDPVVSATPMPTPTPSAAPVSSADAALLEYVATLPTIRDVTADSVDEYTELVCGTLRSPKMSPDFFGSVLAVQEQGYSLTAAQATGLLRATAQAGCPDALAVVESKGAESASVPAG